MKVDIYDLPAAEPFARNVPLAECYPGAENAEALQEATAALTHNGHHWEGGGAAARFLLTLVKEA